jgi:hypothetical protein
MEKAPTKREALEICIRMWDWLTDHPEKSKWGAIFELKLPQDMSSSCSACEYDDWASFGGAPENTLADYGKSDRVCTNCPVWDYDGRGEMCLSHEYGEWQEIPFGKNPLERSRLAEAIANRARRKLDELEELENAK